MITLNWKQIAIKQWRDHQSICVLCSNSNGTTNACLHARVGREWCDWIYLEFVDWNWISKHLPKFPSFGLLSNCIIVRWMLPFGLIADELNFFLRWINSIFHGGRSTYRCELGDTVVLDDDAMPRCSSLRSTNFWSSIFGVDGKLQLRFNNSIEVYLLYNFVGVFLFFFLFQWSICRDCRDFSAHHWIALYFGLICCCRRGFFFLKLISNCLHKYYEHARQYNPYGFIPALSLSVARCVDNSLFFRCVLFYFNLFIFFFVCLLAFSRSLFFQSSFVIYKLNRHKPIRSIQAQNTH